jgi:hypothetical protein
MEEPQETEQLLLPEFNSNNVWTNDSFILQQLNNPYNIHSTGKSNEQQIQNTNFPSPPVEYFPASDKKHQLSSSSESFLTAFAQIQSDNKRMYQCTWNTGSGGICGKTFTRKSENAKAHW